MPMPRGSDMPMVLPLDLLGDIFGRSIAFLPEAPEAKQYTRFNFLFIKLIIDRSIRF
jgi:hypothetical protein